MLVGVALAGPALVAGVVLAPSAALAQDYTSGTLSGDVKDSAGKPVAGAKVVITSAQGVTRETTTGEDGAFRTPALAIGAYTVKIESEGNAPKEDRVNVTSGVSTYAFVVNQTATAGADGTVAEVVVTAARRVSDFNKTDTGLSVDVQEIAGRVPVGRSISSIVQLAPGAGFADPSITSNGVRRDQNVVTLAGASAAESAYYINGLNVTDQRTFLGYADLPFEAISQIDIKAGGYAAEFGRATGGVLNIVTRSGSNTFEGGASAYFSPDSLTAGRGISYQPGVTGNPGSVVYNQFAETDSTDATLWLSGPLLRDRLFFFGLFNARSRETFLAPISVGPTGAGRTNGSQTFTSTDDPRWMAKVDFNITDNHRLEATIFSDRQDIYYQPYDWTLADGRTNARYDYTSRAGGLNQIYKYTGVFTEWLTVSAAYGEVQSIYKDVGDAIGTSGIRDQVRGINIGPGSSIRVNLDGEDTRKTYRFDADIYASFFGEHHFRVGYDREDITSRALVGYTGGVAYTLRNGDVTSDGVAEDYVQVTTFNNDGTFEAEQTALYAQDSWEVNDRLSIQAGIRWDKYDHKNIEGVSYISIDDQFAPRLGFTFDPTGDRATRIYGSYGHYYLPIATNTSIRASSGEAFYRDYYAMTRDVNGNAVIGPDGRPVMGAQLRSRNYLSPAAAPDPRGVADQNLKPMYDQEFVLGFEHSFDFGWTLGARYIDRQLASGIEDTALGDAIVRYCDRTGRTDCVESDQYQYALINPGKEARVLVDFDLASGPGAPQVVTLTRDDLNLPEVERRYQALEFTFERPFDGKWGVQGSYTFSRSVGNYEGAVKSDVGQTDTSITQDFDHYYNMIGSRGRLPNDRPHVFKAFGTYSPMENLLVGANVRVESGRPYGCLGYSPDPTHEAGTPSAWSCVIDGVRTSVPRGSAGRTDWVSQIDLNAIYSLPLPIGEMQFRVDVFNLLDGDAVTRVVEQGETTDGKGTPAAFYGMPRTYQAPRSIRFGLSYKF